MMKSYTRVLAGGALVTAILMLCTSAAFAGRFQFSNATSTTFWRATWSSLELRGGFGTVNCTLTLEGNLHSNTMTKTPSTLIGYVRVARTNGCGSFGGTILSETLPWHLQYESFTGTLPSIASLSFKIIGFSLKIREPTFGITCLYTTPAEGPMRETLNREAGGVVRSATIFASLNTREGCGSTTLSGTSATYEIPPAVSTAITLTLI